MALFLLSIFLFISMTFLSVSARDWREGDNGISRWDFNCNFNGRDIGVRPSTGEQCGGVCIANPECTHFTHSGGSCYMKRYTGSDFREEYANGQTCGFIINRSGQPLRRK